MRNFIEKVFINRNYNGFDFLAVYYIIVLAETYSPWFILLVIVEFFASFFIEANFYHYFGAKDSNGTK